MNLIYLCRLRHFQNIHCCKYMWMIPLYCHKMRWYHRNRRLHPYIHQHLKWNVSWKEMIHFCISKICSLIYRAYYITHHLPEQVTPSPEYPLLQVQLNDPTVLSQFAVVLQLWSPLVHSSTSKMKCIMKRNSFLYF